jgi:hypothetical protein
MWLAEAYSRNPVRVGGHMVVGRMSEPQVTGINQRRTQAMRAGRDRRNMQVLELRAGP